MSEATIFEINKQNIDKRLSTGLALMEANYELKEVDTQQTICT